MATYFSHLLEMGADEWIAHPPSETLALVDLESYPTFIGETADRLDLMVHLQSEMDRLTAFVWDVPKGPLRVRLHVTEDHKEMERYTFGHRPPSAMGTVRTFGRLCLVGHDRLLDCARDSSHSLLKGGRMAKESRPHLLTVPPGIFYVLAYYQWPEPSGSRLGQPAEGAATSDYVVFLHHYPHPAPRLSPVRLPGFVPRAA